MTREVVLTRGFVALVDDEDFERLGVHRWAALVAPRTVYAKRDGPNRRTIYLHREILDAPHALKVDHIDGNGLDCRRSNMRLVTHAQNMRNVRAHADRKAPFKGLTWCVYTRKWAVRLKLDGKALQLGRYAEVNEAARAYDEAARMHFGEFAAVNFPRPGERCALPTAPDLEEIAR